MYAFPGLFQFYQTKILLAMDRFLQTSQRKGFLTDDMLLIPHVITEGQPAGNTNEKCRNPN